MHSGIINLNGHKLLCDAHAVLEQHRVTAALFLFYSLSCFSSFFFLYVCHSDSPVLFLGASIVCFKDL